MAKNVLFLVHGVGRQPVGWADAPGGPLAVLQEASQEYAPFKGKKLRELFDIVPIQYDHIFDRILDGWAKLGKKLRPGLKELDSEGPFADMTDLLDRAGDDKNTLLRIGGDVPLYKAFPLFAQRVQLDVAVQLMRAIEARYVEKKKSGSLARFVAVGHSLGTTVLHDALQRLGTENWIDEKLKGWAKEGGTEAADAYRGARTTLASSIDKNPSNPFAPGFVSFKAVYMLSNTSQLLHTTVAPEDSIVCPLPRDGQPAYCQTFFNVDHVHDPISKVRPFKLPKSWEENGAANLELRHCHEYNIHAFSHYLRHPELHLRLLGDLVDSFDPGAPGETALIDIKKTPYGGPLKAMVDAQRVQLEARVAAIMKAALDPTVAELKRFLATCEAMVELGKSA